MKQYLEIKSFGEIDVQAFTLIGASTKRNDSSKIGMYGSGNKYAIASLLNQGIDFKVFTGDKEIIFSTRSQSFREQNFKVILVNGLETSLTVSMGGSDWNNAFAPIREIYSNALDEDDNATISKVSNLEGEDGYTKFFVELTEDVEHFYKNVHLYFCKKNPNVLSSNLYGSIYNNPEKSETRIFRKGILSYHNKKDAALYQYNLEDIEINESRVIKYTWMINSELSKIWKSCKNEDLISSLLLNLNGGNSGYIEHRISWESLSEDFTNEWFSVCENKKFAPVEYLDMFSEQELKNTYKLPMVLLRALKAKFPDLDILGMTSKTDSNFVAMKPNQILVDKVIDAVAKLSKTRYRHRFTDPKIEYVKFFNQFTLGLAEDDKIYLSTKLDSYSVDEIAKIIIEENEHNLTSLQDETRDFQNHLFSLYYDQLIS